LLIKMAHFMVNVERSPDNYLVVKEFNKRINSNNPIFIMFQGKASLLLKGSEQNIFFNIRVYPFEPPLYKYILYAMFKRMIKKKGFNIIPKMMSSSEMEKVLEVYL